MWRLGAALAGRGSNVEAAGVAGVECVKCSLPHVHAHALLCRRHDRGEEEEEEEEGRAHWFALITSILCYCITTGEVVCVQ